MAHKNYDIEGLESGLKLSKNKRLEIVVKFMTKIGDFMTFLEIMFVK